MIKHERLKRRGVIDREIRFSLHLHFYYQRFFDILKEQSWFPHSICIESLSLSLSFFSLALVHVVESLLWRLKARSFEMTMACGSTRMIYLLCGT